MEEPLSEALVEVPTESKVLKTAELEETSEMEEAEVSMAPAQLIRSPSLPPGGEHHAGWRVRPGGAELLIELAPPRPAEV